MILRKLTKRGSSRGVNIPYHWIYQLGDFNRVGLFLLGGFIILGSAKKMAALFGVDASYHEQGKKLVAQLQAELDK